MNRKTGVVKVTRLVCSHDCGLIVNPDALKSTIAANLIQSLGRTTKEEVHVRPQQRHERGLEHLPVARASDVPAVVDIVLINRPELPPGGAGEPSSRATAAAIANAVFDATGARVRQIPLTPENVKAALTALEQRRRQQRADAAAHRSARPVLIRCRDRLADRPEHRHVRRDRDRRAACHLCAIGDHAERVGSGPGVADRDRDPEMAGRSNATPPPANLIPRVKNPAPANTRVDAASYSMLTGSPNCVRLSVGASDCAAPSLSTSIVGAHRQLDWRLVAEQADLAVEVQASQAADRARWIALPMMCGMPRRSVRAGPRPPRWTSRARRPH